MTMRIQSIIIEDDTYGSWTYSVDSSGSRHISGIPFPSEEEAHLFQESVIPKIEAQLPFIFNLTFPGTNHK